MVLWFLGRMIVKVIEIIHSVKFERSFHVNVKVIPCKTYE